MSLIDKFKSRVTGAPKPATPTPDRESAPVDDALPPGTDSRRHAEFEAERAGAKWRAEAEAKGEVEKEIGGPKGLEPTRYGDWEKAGRCYDF